MSPQPCGTEGAITVMCSWRQWGAGNWATCSKKPQGEQAVELALHQGSVAYCSPSPPVLPEPEDTAESQEGLIRPWVLGIYPRDPDAADQGWGPRMCLTSSQVCSCCCEARTQKNAGGYHLSETVCDVVPVLQLRIDQPKDLLQFRGRAYGPGQPSERQRPRIFAPIALPHWRPDVLGRVVSGQLLKAMLRKCLVEVGEMVFNKIICTIHTYIFILNSSSVALNRAWHFHFWSSVSYHMIFLTTVGYLIIGSHWMT